MIGATALPTGSPYFDVLIYGGAAAIVVAVVGLLVLWWTSPKPEPQKPQKEVPPPERRETVTYDLENVGEAHIARTKSGADKLVRGREIQNLSTDDNDHEPRAGA
jgi:hypothetical protein